MEARDLIDVLIGLVFAFIGWLMNSRGLHQKAIVTQMPRSLLLERITT